MAGKPGRSGRKPLPTALHVIHGNPSKKALNRDEPRPEPLWRLPEPPDHVGEYGKEEWEARGEQLLSMGVLTEADLPAFELYCTAWNYWKTAHLAHLEALKGGLDADTVRLLEAHARLEQRYRDKVHIMLLEFGLTPSARTRIKVVHPPDEQDEREKLKGFLKKQA